MRWEAMGGFWAETWHDLASIVQKLLGCHVKIRYKKGKVKQGNIFWSQVRDVSGLDKNAGYWG